MRLVVIGGVAAGMSAAARARRCDPSLEITVIERGPRVSWGACGLPYFIEGRVPSAGDLVQYTPEYFRDQRGIDVRTGVAVSALEHSRRQVALANGERIRYDRLVVATGARPDTSGIEGCREPNVFTLASMEDACRLKSFLVERKPARAAIIGAGYLGLELAEVIRGFCQKLSIYEARPDVFGRRDAALTEAIRKHLERFGIELILGERIRSADQANADVVIIATGFRPNVELAAAAGVELGRTGALRVDDRLETNVSGIFAAGDCAETVHLVSGRPVYIPLGTTANKMGRVAGANAAGRRERFPGVAGTVIARVCGAGVAVTGLSAEHARACGFDPISARIEAMEKPVYFFGTPTAVELAADRRSGRIIGGSVIGETAAAGRINVIAAAVSSRMHVDDFEHLDLAYAPPFAPVWDPLLVAAQQLRKLL